jgi:predicted NACHT family NTPase
MLTELIIKEGLSATFRAIKNLLADSDRKLLSSTQDMEQALYDHLQFVENWSAEVSFSDLKNDRHINDIFVELDLFLQPMRFRHEEETVETIPFRKIFDSSMRHFILLGQPGAGKTTSDEATMPITVARRFFPCIKV